MERFDMKNFAAFQATRRHVPDLLEFSKVSGFDYCAGLEDRTEPQAGFVYDDGSLYIEDNGETVYLLLGREDWIMPRARLAELELHLYAWASCEFYHDAKPEDADAAQIAVTFARVLQEWLTPSEWQEMRALNAAEPGRNAEHEYCDANMAMAAAFKHEGKEALPDLEAGMTDAAVELWNKAWDMANPLLGGPVAESEPDLVAEYVAYCDGHGLPAMSADELSVILTGEQRAVHGVWLGEFITRWDAMRERTA
jgi:hypothetical protein